MTSALAHDFVRGSNQNEIHMVCWLKSELRRHGFKSGFCRQLCDRLLSYLIPPGFSSLVQKLGQ